MFDHTSIVSDLAREIATTDSGTENFEDELDMDGTDVSTDDSNAAMVDGVWKSDASRHTIDGPMKRTATSKYSIEVQARDDLPTIRVAYFFSGVERKASIGNKLKNLCAKHGYGLRFEEIDILVGGKSTTSSTRSLRRPTSKRSRAARSTCRS